MVLKSAKIVTNGMHVASHEQFLIMINILAHVRLDIGHALDWIVRRHAVFCAILITLHLVDAP
jgi:hypothetical protein